MEFEKVTKQHILQGITDFVEKGMPKGFGPSSTYDLVYQGKNYPPKAMMAYANYHATEKEPINNFSGGANTPCFKAFARLGIPIIEKN